MANGRQPQQQQPVNPAGVPMNKQIGAGLIKAGFAGLGATWGRELQSQGVAQALTDVGTGIAETLHMRWYQNQMNDFMAQHGQKYMEQGATISQDIKTREEMINKGIDPTTGMTFDPASREADAARDALQNYAFSSIKELDLQFLNEASKFKANPLIDQMAANLMAQRTQAIQQMLGPGPVQEGEALQAGTELKRAQGKAALIGARASAQNRTQKETDPVALMQKWGPQRFVKWLRGDPNGQQYLAPYTAQAQEEVAAQLIRENPELAGNENALNMAIAQNNKAIMDRASGLYMGTNFPGAMQALQGEEFKGLVPEPIEQAYQFSGKAHTQEDKQRVTGWAEQETLDTLNSVVRGQKPASYKQATDIVVDIMKDKIARGIAPESRDLRKRAISSVMNQLSRRQEVFSAVQIAKETYGPKKSQLFKKKDKAMTQLGVSGVK